MNHNFFILFILYSHHNYKVKIVGNYTYLAWIYKQEIVANKRIFLILFILKIYYVFQLNKKY